VDQIENHYITTYANNFEMVSQQETSRIRELVTFDSFGGKEKSYNDLGATTMRQITMRNGATVPQEQDMSKVFIRPAGYDSVAFFDEFDDTLLGQITKPTHETVQSQGAAYGRTLDKLALAAAIGTRYIGETGTETDALPSGQKVDVDWKGPGVTPANTGLTLAKLIKAKSVLGRGMNAQSFQRGDLVMAVKQQHLDDLLYSCTQVHSQETNAVKALVNGDVDYFMGFRFVLFSDEVMPWINQGSDISAAIAWHKRGIVVTEGTKKVHMDIRADLNHTLQIRTVGWLGAVRRRNERVVQIACDESPAT